MCVGGGQGWSSRLPQKAALQHTTGRGNAFLKAQLQGKAKDSHHLAPTKTGFEQKKQNFSPVHMPTTVIS